MKHLTRNDLIAIQSYLNVVKVHILNICDTETADVHQKIILNIQDKIDKEILSMKMIIGEYRNEIFSLHHTYNRNNRYNQSIPCF